MLFYFQFSLSLSLSLSGDVISHILPVGKKKNTWAANNLVFNTTVNTTVVEREFKQPPAGF